MYLGLCCDRYLGALTTSSMFFTIWNCKVYKHSLISSIEKNHVLLIISFIRIEGNFKKLGSCHLRKENLVSLNAFEVLMSKCHSQKPGPSLKHLQ